MKLVDVVLSLLVFSGICSAESSASCTANGATYTRWGRTNCPGDAELVYKGYAGGSGYTETGGGVNYLCLPDQPLWGNYNDRPDNHVSFVHGAEYQLSGTYNKDIFGPGSSSKLLNYDVPCVVCQCKSRSHVLMVPARNECFGGWTLEYAGYLMTQYYNYNAKDYICVDQKPNLQPGLQRDDNGALLYLVEAKCGSLPCGSEGPYVNYRELTCAVCTK